MPTRDNSPPPIIARVAAISGALLVILLAQSILIWNPAQHLWAASADHHLPAANIHNGIEQPAGCEASTYQVQPGDTITGVASRSGTSSQRVRDCNDLSSDVVYAGQILNLPGQVNSNQEQTPNVRVTRARATPQAPNRQQASNNGSSGNGQRGAGPPQRRRR